MDRRHFLRVTAAATAAASLHRASFAQDSTSLILHTDRPGPVMPLDFVGLSYERQQLADPTFFSAANTGLIARFRQLAPHGALRIGGNTAEFSWWKPTPNSVAPPRPPSRDVGNGEPATDFSYSVTPLAVDNLAAFLKATGWSVIYGLNLGTATPAINAQEAAYVTRVLDPHLQYLQIGNEADLFGKHLRDPKAWNADAYLAEWLAHARAIAAAVPAAKFGILDVASSMAWVTKVGELWPTVANKPQLVALSHHYYFTGPPDNPNATIPRLLAPDPRVLRDAATTATAARLLNARFRMTEGNTCYRGGKPGFSDVFAASLWAADYALTLASLGYAGINLHGGGGNEVANSLGGSLPGEALMPDPKAPHPRPFYTPIANIDSHYVPEPVFFGLQFAGHLAGSTIIPVTLNAAGINATAYAAKMPTGHTLIAIINKDATRDLALTINARAILATETLTAPALDAHSATLAHQPVSHLMRSAAEPIPITIPHASAKLITI